MVYLVGGYKLTEDQVLEWCRPRNIQPPDGNTTLFVNRWLRSQGIKNTRLLACDYYGETIFLVVTDRKVDGIGSLDNFEAFRESERACQIKKLLQVGDVEFVTVPNPYGY
jgi:hypothetical protein